MLDRVAIGLAAKTEVVATVDNPTTVMNPKTLRMKALRIVSLNQFYYAHQSKAIKKRVSSSKLNVIQR
jgi:hypothetical protein